MSVKLDVPYYAQNDNELWSDGTPGYAQCNVTTHAMLCAYLVKGFEDRSKQNGFKEPESYLKSKFYKYSSNRGDHTAMTQALKEFGIESEWRYDGNFSDIRNQLLRGEPVPIGVNYKTSGHIILVVGFEGDRYLIHDPYGIRDGSLNSYQVNPGYGSTIGKFDTYSQGLLDDIWFSGEGWYRKIP